MSFLDMLTSMMADPLTRIRVIAIFGLVLFLWLAMIMAVVMRSGARRERIERRLDPAGMRGMAERELRLWIDGKEQSTHVPAPTARRSFSWRLARLYKDAGFVAPPMSIVLTIIGLVTLAFLLVFMYSQNLVLSGVAAFGAVMMVQMYISSRITKQEALFERQLVDALGLANRSLRAGHPLVGAFQLIVEEMKPPIRQVFGDIVQEQSLGIGLDEALKNAANKSNSTDMRLFATATIIQLRSGGNLADMMDRLGMVVRERMRLARRVRVLTAQTQFSKRILIALPFIVCLLLMVLNPDYMRPLYTTNTGQLMLGVGMAFIVTGGWIMNRMVRLKY